MVTRAARLLTICSIFVIFASYEATVWDSVWAHFSNLDTLCMSSGNFAICMNMSLIFSSIELARYPVPSMSGREPSGDTTFEEEGWYRRYWHINSIAHTCHEKRWETTKPEKLVNGKNTAHVRTRNGLSHNGYGCVPRSILKSCSQTGSTSIFAESVTLSGQNRDIWHTSRQWDKRVGFQFPLVIISAAPQYTNCSVLSCHAKIELRCEGVAANGSFPHRSRSSRSDIGIPS